MVVALKVYTTRHLLEQFLAEQRFGLRLRHGRQASRTSDVVARSQLLGHEVLTTCLHIVDQNHANLVFVSNGLQARESRRDHLLTIVVAHVSRSEVLSERVKHDELQVLDLEHNLLEHLVE